jgi:hypothetical protein
MVLLVISIVCHFHYVLTTINIHLFIYFIYFYFKYTLTLIRMTKDENGLAFFKGLLL